MGIIGRRSVLLLMMLVLAGHESQRIHAKILKLNVRCEKRDWRAVDEFLSPSAEC